MPERCPRCGSGNIVGYMGEWECMDCRYRFKLPTSYTVPRRADIRKRAPVGKLIMVAVILAVLPWLIILLTPLLDHSKNVGGILATIASSLFIVFGLYTVLNPLRNPPYSLQEITSFATNIMAYNTGHQEQWA